ncbi:MAG: rRNA maturation RNase YbeY [Rhodospirillales bacterium]|nr:rRNA maturation RNase YbeY [Alphaproteobacteria bacterium]MCB9987441.1 rRNA maturation RNase YbeY [Rhodospirillales bacterium]USO07579.1 MAG: rRNA maturation RNase YbeY [Rhodospirillales bacterium]
MPEFVFDVVRESPLWARAPRLKTSVARIAGLLEGRASGHVSYIFSDDAMVQGLNLAWRGKDKPTNVLSFPDGDADETGITHLGDVILAHETVTREAEEMGIPVDDHLAHLILHGSLHLLGYDHETEAEAQVMENLETELLARIGIKDPYQSGARALD